MCQKLIWNVRTTGKVNLNTTGGAILLPFATDVKVNNGNSCGWIVTGGTVDVSQEFHFIYQGGSRDSFGQMHFALRKGFVDNYGTKTQIESTEPGTPKANTSININSGNMNSIGRNIVIIHMQMIKK